MYFANMLIHSRKNLFLVGFEAIFQMDIVKKCPIYGTKNCLIKKNFAYNFFSNKCYTTKHVLYYYLIERLRKIGIFETCRSTSLKMCFYNVSNNEKSKKNKTKQPQTFSY